MCFDETPRFVQGDNKKRLGVTEKKGARGDRKEGSGRQKDGSKCIIDLFGLRRQKNTK